MALGPIPEKLLRQIEQDDLEWNRQHPASVAKFLTILFAYIVMALGALYFVIEFIR